MAKHHSSHHAAHHAAHGHGGHHQGGHHQGHHGHHGHQGHAIVVVPGRKKGGGPVEPSSGKPKEDERTKEMIAEEEKGHKRGGKVKGHHSMPRADKRARGGRMTPKEPFSGADGAEPSYARSHRASKSEGVGREVRP